MKKSTPPSAFVRRMVSFGMESRIRVTRKEREACFSIYWTALRKGDRWQIAASVPAVGGVYEIYWMDERKHLRLLTVGHARYGGLRSEIRRLIDPELTVDKATAAILEDREIWFRYAPIDSAQDMADIVWFFRKTYFPEDPGVPHSGRYDRIYVDETAPDKVRWVD